MRFKKLLACVLSAGITAASLTGALAGAALETGGRLIFEAEETMVATYDNLTPASPGNYGQSAGTANALCANTAGLPQIADSSSKKDGFAPLYFVFAVDIPENGYYSMAAKYRGHETGRLISFYAGSETGVGEDPKTLDVSKDTLLGKVNAAYFSGGNANHIETQNVSDTGRTGQTDAAANRFQLTAGKIYIKALITGVSPNTNADQTRLNLDQLVLTFEGGQLKADYAAVDAAIAKVPADLSGYTAESVQVLQAAVQAVVRDLSIDEQSRVDDMAKAIERAIAGLEGLQPMAMQYLASDCTDPENSSKAFATQPFSGAPDFSRFEGMEVGDTAQYVINVPADGEYLLKIDYRAHESVGKAYFYLNGEKQAKNFDSPGSPNTRQEITMGRYNLKKGANVLKFEMYEKSSNGSSAKLNIFYFNIKPYAPPQPPAAPELEYLACAAADPANSTPDILASDFEEYELSLVNATEPGQYASYKLDIEEAGDYRILVQYRAGANCGNAKTYVNGQAVSGLFGCSGIEEKTYYENLGVHSLKKGENTVKFEIAGKDASRKGYNLVLYSFYLTPAGAQVDSGFQGFTQLSPARSTEKVEIYPNYSVNTASSLYTVKVDGLDLPVITYGQDEYDYGEFSMKSGPVQVEVTFKDTINTYEISPKKLGLTGTVSGNKLTFTLERDEYLILKINGNNRRLILTADPAQTDAPASQGEGVFNVTAAPYNADGTGRYFATLAIQRAIDDAARYGTEKRPGVVYVPAGVYQTGSLMLRSNVQLYLEGGATLWGATRMQEWIPKGRKNSIGKGVSYMVYTDDNTAHTKIYGRGTVDGNAKTFKRTDGWRIAVECLAPVNTSYFTTDGVVYRGSGIWCVVPAFSNHLEFLNFKVYNNTGYGEDDGIDINGCQDVVVRNSISVNWDDPYSTKTEHAGGFEINAGWGPEEGKTLENRNILFDDCIAWTGCYGFKVGQGIGYDQHDITVQNSTVYDCAVGFGIHHKRFDGKIWNVAFDNIEVENITRQNEDHKMWFQCFLQDDNKQAEDGDMIWNVSVKNINVWPRSPPSPKLVCRRDGSYITGVTFENITMYGSTAPANSMGQLGFTVNGGNPLLQNSADKSRGHVYNANNYGVIGAASSKIPAVYYNNGGAAIAVEKEPSAFGGMVARLTKGTPALYNMVDFGTGVSSADIRYASDTRGTVELRLDSPDGQLIGTLTADGADSGAYQTQTLELTGAVGMHDLYLVASDTVKLDYIDFGRVRYAVIGEQTTLQNLQFAGGVSSIDLTAIAERNGSVQLYENDASGPLLGEVRFTANQGTITKTLTLTQPLTGVKTLYIAASEGIDVEAVSFVPTAAAALPYIQSAVSPAAKTVDYGTAASALQLPDKAAVVLSDGRETEAAVTWDTSLYDGQKAGVYELKGTLAPSDEFTNENGVTVTITITVSEQPGEDIVPGDMDGNGEVTIQDVMEACKVLARQSAGKAPTEDEMKRGNLDGDDKFTITDVMEICKILARKA